MTQPSPDNKQASLLKVYVLAGTAILIATLASLTIVVSEGQGDSATRVVFALAPFLSGAITLIGTGLGHKQLAKQQTNIQTDVAEVKQESADGVVSDKIERVTRQVLTDPVIQQQIADKLGRTLIQQASDAGIKVQQPTDPKKGK